MTRSADPIRRPLRWRGLRRGLARDRSGATAIEFAVLALPFVLTLLAVLEYGYVYLVQVSLEDATAVASRQIRTGQAQTKTTTTTAGGVSVTSSTPLTQGQFKTLVCDNMKWVSGCYSTLLVESEVQSSWAGQTSTSPTVGGVVKPTLPFDMGQPGSIVLIHSFYPWKMITPALWTGAAKLNGNSVLLGSAAVICNEPYGATTPSTQC